MRLLELHRDEYPDGTRIYTLQGLGGDVLDRWKCHPDMGVAHFNIFMKEIAATVQRFLQQDD